MSYYPPPIPPQGIAPIPVQPVSYATPGLRDRPGILTAVGILSIVIACISAVMSLGGAFMSLGFAMMRSMPMPTPATVVTTPATVTGGTVTSSEDGFNQGMTQNIASALRRKRDLNERQVAQINALLNQSGKRIFPFDTKTITPQLIRSNITESGDIPGVGGGNGSTYYVVGTGRIEVYDDHAVFRADGASEVVSVSADSAGDNSPSGTPSAPPISPRRSQRVTYTMTPTGTGGAPMMPFSRVNLGVIYTMMAENLASMLLSVLLFIAGIMTLRDARSAGRLHWIYIWLKIPLVIVATAMGVLFWQSFMSAASPPGAALPMPFYVASAFFGAVFALAYPLGLIFVLMNRSVRAFYGPVVE